MAIVCGLGGWAGAARADGDPASDVLATQPLFLPQDAGIPGPQQVQLAALLQEAAGRGYPIRVALIASPADLGSIGELWRQPAGYARFLGQELALTYRGTLLVVMPNGFGLYGPSHPVGAGGAALSGIPIRPTRAGLAATALRAISALAASAGHPLALPRAGSAAARGASDPMPWIVFVLGLIVIGAAWAASLRARPLRSGREDVPA